MFRQLSISPHLKRLRCTQALTLVSSRDFANLGCLQSFSSELNDPWIVTQNFDLLYARVCKDFPQCKRSNNVIGRDPCSVTTWKGKVFGPALMFAWPAPHCRLVLAQPGKGREDHYASPVRAERTRSGGRFFFTLPLFNNR